jgi:hypothetical protein
MRRLIGERAAARGRSASGDERIGAKRRYLFGRQLVIHAS